MRTRRQRLGRISTTPETTRWPPSQGKLVIWLMGHNQGLFERIASYGYHGIQPHYSNGSFAGLTKTQYEDSSGTAIGKIRFEAATGEDFSPPEPSIAASTDVTRSRCLRYS